jgi:hypothetical protein
MMLKPNAPAGSVAVLLHERLAAWPRITTAPERFGAVAYMLEGREVGHVHGTSHADLPLPKPLRNQLIASGGAEPHHILPESGWVSVPFAGEGALDRATEAFRLNYNVIASKKGVEPVAG